MTAHRGTGGGLPIPVGAPAPAIGGDNHRRNLRMAFENLAAPVPVPRLEPGGLPFKFSDLLQAVLDVFALFFIATFLALTAVGVGVAIFILFFVRTT